MRNSMILVMHCLIVLVLSSAFIAADGNFDDLWKVYKVKHGKVYRGLDEDARRVIWERNAKIVAKHNLEADHGLHTYWKELNKFSDRTSEELDVYRKCLKYGNHTKRFKPQFVCDKKCHYTLPKSVDWRTKGFVTPIKDQGACGSCYAFSATGSLEGQNMATRGILVSLSEQNIVDCSWEEGNDGCNGGLMEYAFNYVLHNKGIDTEVRYPYIATEQSCNFDREGVGAKCSGFVSIKPNSELDLQAAVANIGPVSVAIDASSDSFMQYRDGIFYSKECSSKYLDHGVLVVGYGTENGRDYWIVKNSWGINWGKQGYILMARNAHNMCGIASQASYPLM